MTMKASTDPQARPAASGVEETPSKDTYTYKRVGECDLKADVFRSPGSEVRSAIVGIHGGALMFGDRAPLETRAAAALPSAGYAVVAIDYRLAPETKLPDNPRSGLSAERRRDARHPQRDE